MRLLKPGHRLARLLSAEPTQWFPLPRGKSHLHCKFSAFVFDLIPGYTRARPRPQHMQYTRFSPALWNYHLQTLWGPSHPEHLLQLFRLGYPPLFSSLVNYLALISGPTCWERQHGVMGGGSHLFWPIGARETSPRNCPQRGNGKAFKARGTP